MADRIKTVSTYNGTSWGSEVPIGADASNVDVTLSNNTKSDLQTVLGSTPSGSSVTERINSKVSTSGGDVADTVVSKNISNYDSSTDAGSDILTDTAATMSTNTSTLWSRFNLFRKKVSNNFENYFAKSSLVGSDVGVTSTGDDNTAYTTAAINNYLSNVIGYTSASAPAAGNVATQLSTLNSKTASIAQHLTYDESWNLASIYFGTLKAGLEISGTTATAGQYLQFASTTDGKYVGWGANTGGIYNKTTSSILYGLLTIHVIFDSTVSAPALGITVWRQTPSTSGQYESYSYLGLIHGYNSHIDVNMCFVVPIEIAIALRCHVSGGKATVGANSYIRFTPFTMSAY